MVIMDSRLRPSRRKHRGHRRRVRPHFAMRRDSLACRASCYMANYSSCATFGPAGFGCGAGSDALCFRSVDAGASVDVEAFGSNCQIGVNLMAELFDFLSGLVSCIVIALAPLSLTSTGYFPELNRSALSEIFPAIFT